MRKPRVKNKYNLKFADIKKLIIKDRSKLQEPLFWRNNVVSAWCIIETTAKNSKDLEFETYNEYWIGIFDENSKRKRKIDVNCSGFGGMTTYKFKKFFDYSEIENELDLEIQEKLLSKINFLIDEGILELNMEL